jgi:hypothetical protein
MGIQIAYVDGGRLYVGAIQRTPAMDVEFHGQARSARHARDTQP